MRVFTIIPAKNLEKSKTRLTPILSPRERRNLSLAMLNDVIQASRSAKSVEKTVVVSPDDSILRLAEHFGLHAIRDAEVGLNEALAQAVEWCVKCNATMSLIIPSDIPLLKSEDLDSIVALAPKKTGAVICRSLDGGTNALLCKPPGLIAPMFGPQSFEAHSSEASRLGVSCLTYDSKRVSFDIDTPEDLCRLDLKECGPYTRRYLKLIRRYAEICT